MSRCLVPVVLEILVLSGSVAVAAPPVKHPNLLLNADEIKQVKAKIAKYSWAAAALEKTKEHALNGPAHENSFVNQALYYAFTGDKTFADRARAELLNSAKSELPEFRKLDLATNRGFGSWSSWGARAWTYDLVYDTCSDAERAQIEEWFRVSCQVLIDTCKRWSTTPNLMFGKHVNIGLVGYGLGDKEIIDWVLNDPGAFGPHCGGFSAVMDTMIRDGRFWGEAPIYALVYDVTNMLALAEAARHYDGTDLYHWTSKKSGASMKSVVDGYLLMGYPLERTGFGRGRVRLATFGDGGTSFNPSGTMGKDPEDLTNPSYGDGPVTSGEPYCFFDGSPEPASPVAVVRQQAQAATFAAVHEPYERSPSVEQVRRLAEDDSAVALLVKTPGYTDYVCVGFGDREHTLAAGGESFVFTEYGYLRAQGGKLTARGKLRAFKVLAPQGGSAVVLNGNAASARREGEAVVYGAAPTSTPTITAPKSEDDPRERNAALHYWWLPEEVHISALLQYGIPSVEGASRWRTPAGFIWQGSDNLTIGADPARLHYKFYEDRMVCAVAPPTDPTKTWTMWMGTFEGLDAPLHTGKQEQPWLPITADWLFFPHPTYRQGLLLIPPRQAPVKYCLGGPDCDAVNFSIKAGQEVSLQFATQAEVDVLKQSGKLPPRKESNR